MLLSNQFHSIDSIRALTAHLWMALVFVWLAMALMTKPTVQRQSSKGRIWYLFMLVCGAYLVFSKDVGVSWLNLALFPVHENLAISGFVLACVGILFSIWARLILGSNWSGAVTIKQNHTLIQRGPYRIVRHPIYTGILLSLMGTVLQYGLMRSLLGWLLVGLGLKMKSLMEEQFMIQRFGEEYTAYRQHVRALIPFLL